MDIDGESPLAKVIDLLVDAVCVVDPQGRFVFVSAAFERIFGYRPDEIIGRTMIDLVLPDDRERTLGAVDRIVAGDDQLHFENRYVRKDGGIVDIVWSARWSPVQRVRVAVARDVTARKRAESRQAALYAISEASNATDDLDALFDQVRRIIGSLLPVLDLRIALRDGARDHDVLPERPIVDEAADGGASDPHALAAEVMRQGRALYVSPGAASIALAVESIGDGAPPIDWLGVPLNVHNHVSGALLVKGRAGAARISSDDIELLHFVSTQVAAAIERKNAETKLWHSAHHDPLTDLPNRSLVRDRVTVELAHARRDDTRLALLYLDLDHFKAANDRHGHAVGDRLLREVARRLVRCVRESDTVGRVGGDEFVVLLGGIRSAEQPLLIAEKIRVALDEPLELGALALSITSSIGVALYPEHGSDYERLVHCADEAMYSAKQDGGNRIAVYGAPR